MSRHSSDGFLAEPSGRHLIAPHTELWLQFDTFLEDSNQSPDIFAYLNILCRISLHRRVQITKIFHGRIEEIDICQFLLSGCGSKCFP